MKVKEKQWEMTSMSKTIPAPHLFPLPDFIPGGSDNLTTVKNYKEGAKKDKHTK